MKDTIFALSTVAGISAISVFRVSGPNAFSVLKKITIGKKPKNRYATLKKIIWEGEVVDQCIIITFEKNDRARSLLLSFWAIKPTPKSASVSRGFEERIAEYILFASVYSIFLRWSLAFSCKARQIFDSNLTVPYCESGLEISLAMEVAKIFF
mgnify:CR=1 FL=1